MLVKRFCDHNVITVTPETTVEAAAACMADQQVGALVVVENNKPVGIVTDRDLVVRAIAQGLPAQQTPVRTVMTVKPICIPEDASLEGAMEQLRFYHVRRIIIVNEAAEVVGIVSLDDIFALLAEEQQALATVTEVMRAVHYEKTNPLPAT